MFHTLQEQRIQEQLQQANLRIQELNEKIESISDKNSFSAAIALPTRNDLGDWTSSYEKWSKWEDVEAIQEEAAAERERLAQLTESASLRNHYHDHSEERKFFEQPESVKREFCERHRALGNYLFEEGLMPKAAEQYRIALSYYEYCFPESEQEQQELDKLRRACLCNISLCFYRIGEWRMSIDAASQALKEDPNHVKALYRRAQAYRELDEYGPASADINLAFRLCPDDKVIQEEIIKLRLQKCNALRGEQELGSAFVQKSAINSSKEISLTDEDKDTKASATADLSDTILTSNFLIPLEPILLCRSKF